MAKYILIAALLLVCLPVAADEIWSELLPDHGSISLQAYKSPENQLDARITAMGSWELGTTKLEADLWNVSPLGAGFSYPAFGPTRFLGLGYDASLPGDEWYDQFPSLR